MGQRTQVLLKLKNKEGKVLNSLYHFQWGFGKTMFAHLMEFVIKEFYVKYEHEAGYDFFKFHKFNGYNISDELDDIYKEKDFDISDLKTLKHILYGHDNNNGYMVIEVVENNKKGSQATIKFGVLQGIENLNSEDLEFQFFVSPREYMEQWQYYCPESFIKCFELFCETFGIITLPTVSNKEEAKGDE